MGRAVCRVSGFRVGIGVSPNVQYCCAHLKAAQGRQADDGLRRIRPREDGAAGEVQVPQPGFSAQRIKNSSVRLRAATRRHNGVSMHHLRGVYVTQGMTGGHPMDMP